ncbi:MAG TPA: hypothetical protein VGE27_12705 [Gemmatimonas sp.]|uniref:hypothetical protein n=1 Tax=Gemmatimonas sp. TaxID=1962908 RepID=UPI002ED9E95A
MKESVRRYLADIGRRGGIRSRRTLTPEQAQAMVASREAKRAVREFEQSAIGTPTSDLPGVEIVRAGLRDLAGQQHSVDALLVSMAAPRLRRLGIRVPVGVPHPEDALFVLLEQQHGQAAHSRYNALVRRMVSFSRAAATMGRQHA